MKLHSSLTSNFRDVSDKRMWLWTKRSKNWGQLLTRCSTVQCLALSGSCDHLVHVRICPQAAVSRQASVPDLSSCRRWDERQAWNEPRLSFSSPSFWHGLFSRTLACRKCFFVSGENCLIAAEGHFFPTTHALCPVEIDLKTNKLKKLSQEPEWIY